MTISEIREETGLSRREFSERYEIPQRTLEDWEAGRRNPPAYLVSLLNFRIKTEDILTAAGVFVEEDGSLRIEE